MIAVWIAFFVMAALVAAYLAPSFLAPVAKEDDAELEAYFSQIDTIQANDDLTDEEASETIAGLQRQILARQDSMTGTGRAKGTAAVTLGLIAVCAAFVYADQSTPLGYESDVPAIAENGASPDISDLVAQLERRLRTDRADDPTGWLLYARTLVSLRRIPEAMRAYDRAAQLSEDPEAVLSEKAQAEASVRQTEGRLDARPERGPSAADIDAANAMSEADRGAMITAMVEGLADRLENEPDNAAGWARLIRARLVLGQTELAAEDVNRMRKVFQDREDIAQEILASAGWVE